MVGVLALLVLTMMTTTAVVNCQDQTDDDWTPSSNGYSLFLNGQPVDYRYLQRRPIRGHPAYRHQLRNSVAAASGEGEGRMRGVSTSMAGPGSLDLVPSKAVEDELDADEPTCEELRTIWRLTKRAAMHSLEDNAVPKYTVGTFGHLLHAPDGPSSSSYGQVRMHQPSGSKYVHGKAVYHPNNMGRRKMDTLHGITAGSYERVEEELRRGLFAEKPLVNPGKKIYASKNRNLLKNVAGVGTGGGGGGQQVVYGTYSNKGGVTVTKDHLRANEVDEDNKQKQLKLFRDKQRMDKLAKTLTKTKVFSPKGECVVNMEGKRCDSSADCWCNGLTYKCTQRKCNSYSSINREPPSGSQRYYPTTVLPVAQKSKFVQNPGLNYYNKYPDSGDGSGWRKADVNDYLLAQTARGGFQVSPPTGYRQQLLYPYYVRKP